MRRHSAISIVLAALVGACSGGPSGEELHARARSLLPEAASTVAEVEGQCVELAPSPSCVHIYFVPAVSSMRERVADAERLAAVSGWTLSRKESLPGGTQLQLHRSTVDASIFLQPPEEVVACRSAPRKGCADAVLVEGEFGI